MQCSAGWMAVSSALPLLEQDAGRGQCHTWCLLFLLVRRARDQLGYTISAVKTWLGTIFSLQDLYGCPVLFGPDPAHWLSVITHWHSIITPGWIFEGSRVPLDLSCETCAARQEKGRSVLLWGYLPEDAGWVGVDFLYVAECFFKRKRALTSWQQLLEGHWHCNFALHSFPNTEGSVCFSHSVFSVALFFSFLGGTKHCLRDVLPNQLWQFIWVGKRTKQQTSHPGRWSRKGEIQSSAGVFFASCDFLAPMENFKRLI